MILLPRAFLRTIPTLPARFHSGNNEDTEQGIDVLSATMNPTVLSGSTCADREEPVTTTLTCPACHLGELSVADYESMMVLRSDLALFTLRCPLCGHRVSTLQCIPPTLEADVRSAADAVGAGMGAE